MNLSCPSYIIPGTWWKNITYIDTHFPEIKNVELLFFIYDEETKKLLAPEEEQILSCKGRLTYTVHLPDPLLPKHEELIEKFSQHALHWIVHPPEQGKEHSFSALINSWREKYGDRFLIENLIGRNHPWFLKNTDLPLCLDTGHALLRGHSPARYLTRFYDRIGEIHLHDCVQGKDHSKLSATSKWLTKFIPLLNSFSGLVNIELFNTADIAASISRITDADAGR